MDRTADRRDALRPALADVGVDALLITSTSNVRYLTGFTGEDASLLVLRDRTLLVSDGRFVTQLEGECPGLPTHIKGVEQTPMEAAADAVDGLGVRRLGFESTSMTVAGLETLTAGRAGLAVVGLRGRVEALRQIKDDDELATIRSSIDAAERAFAATRESLRSGQSEKDVADALDAHLRRCGATASAFGAVVAVGRRAALPHARPTVEARVGDDDFLLVDWGATLGGYASDLTRVLITGKVTPRFERIYRTVLSAQERAIRAIRPGVPARVVDAEARSVIEEAGLGPFFTHGLGHGFGLDVHEEPRLRAGNDSPLRAGMVVTVEPGVYLPEWGGVRIEDDVLITPDGYEVLTRVPKALDSLRAG